MTSAATRLFEAALPWLAGSRLHVVGSLPDVLKSRALEWADDSATRETTLAWKSSPDELKPGQIVVVISDGKPGALTGCEPLLVQYLFADRTGVTAPTGEGATPVQPPLFWLDIEPGKEVLGTVIIARAT